MSLLNQVLRDLDQRQAPSVPAAVKAAAPRVLAQSAGKRAGRWGLGIAATLTAIVAGGWAQGSIRWPAQAADTPVAVAAAVAPTQPIPATPILAPEQMAPAPVSTAPSPAPTIATTVVPTQVVPTPEPAPVTGREPDALQVAIAAPVVHSRPVTPSAMHDVPQVATSKPEPRIEMRAAARSPQERAEAQYQRGVTAHQAGQISDSAAAFNTALREDPRHVGARVAQAGLLIGQSRSDEAMALLKEGTALAPTQPQLALMLARMQAERQDWPTAAETLQGASAHVGSNPAEGAEFHGLHAAILQRAGRHGEAVEKYGLALRLAPGRGVWWMGLAISLEEMGQPDTARAAFQRAKAIGLPEGAAGYVDTRLKQLG